MKKFPNFWSLLSNFFMTAEKKFLLMKQRKKYFIARYRKLWNAVDLTFMDPSLFDWPFDFVISLPRTREHSVEVLHDIWGDIFWLEWQPSPGPDLVFLHGFIYIDIHFKSNRRQYTLPKSMLKILISYRSESETIPVNIFEVIFFVLKFTYED